MTARVVRINVEYKSGCYNIPAHQLLAANLSTMSFLQVTRMEGDGLLAANARLVHQERAFRTFSIVGMTVVINSRVPAAGNLGTLKATLRRRCPAWLRRLEDSLSTVAAYFLEDGLWTSSAEAAMTHLLTVVLATFEKLAAGPNANVLSFDWRDGTLLPFLRCLSLGGLLLPGAAALPTLVTAAVEIGLACSQAPRLLEISMVT